MSVVPFVGFVISPFSSPSMGISWVSVLIVYIWSSRMGFYSCTCDVLLLDSSNKQAPIFPLMSMPKTILRNSA